MDNKVTLEEVVAFPGQLGIEPMGFGMGIVAFSIMVVVSIIIAAMASNNELVGILTVVFFLFGFIGVLYSIAYVNMASEEVVLDYEAGYKKWQAEYVEPYIDSLPLKQVNHLAEVEYDYRLETELENAHKNVPRGLVPLKITEENGKSYSLWGKVDYNEKVEFQFYLFRELTQTLDFDDARNASNLEWYPPIEAGKQDILLYTNDPNWKKYDTEN